MVGSRIITQCDDSGAAASALTFVAMRAVVDSDRGPRMRQRGAMSRCASVAPGTTARESVQEFGQTILSTSADKFDSFL